MDNKKDLYEIVPELTEKAADSKKKQKKKMPRKKKKAVIISVVSLTVALVIALGLIIGIPIYKDLTKVVLKNEDMPMLYVTAEPALKYGNSENGEAVLLSSALYDRNTLSPYSVHDVTPDGKSVYFLDFMGDLYRKNLDSQADNRFIAENVASFNIDENGNILFLSTDGVLRNCKFSSDRDTFKIKDIDSGVSAFWYSKEGKAVLYTKDTEAGKEFYSKTLGIFGSTKLLGTDLGEVVKIFGEDMELVYLLKTSDVGKKTVNIIEDLKSVKTAVNSADEIYSYGTDGTVLYGLRTGIGVDLKTFFTDELVESDKELEEPDFQKLLYNEITEAQFEASQSAWRAKLTRDAIREMIKAESDKTAGFTVYKYEKGREAKIDENVGSVIDYTEDNTVMVYTSAKYKTSGETRGDISSYETTEDAYNAILSILAEGAVSYKTYIKGIDALKTIYHHEKEITKVYMRDDGTGVYVYQKGLEEENATLKYIDIALGNVSAPKEISTTLTEEPVEYNGKLLINEKQVLKGDDSETEVISSSSLFGINKAPIDNNVLLSSLRENSKGEVAYIKDAVGGKGQLMLKDKLETAETETFNVVEVEKDVVSVEFRGGSLYYLTEFGRGYVLTQYKDGVTDNIDEEVLSVISYE
ncbi:MAG: hypothetical protein J6K88_02075 [Oscillospiraceae bacterium]|nr:hypothetical protein [Oscillospiraceae bacterium]